jgi:hypothetical protein
VVELAVAGDVLPINTAVRLHAVLRQTYRVVLNEANRWRVAVPVLVDAGPWQRTLGSTRHFVEVR